jgi:hypothetical protein
MARRIPPHQPGGKALTRAALVLCLLATACCCARVQPSAMEAAPLPAPIPVSAPPPVAVMPPAPAAQLDVVKRFDVAKSKEITAVMAPDATRSQIERISAAHADAAEALTRLGEKHNRRIADALHAAKVAVRALEDAIDE